jgi:hypothetical protein
MGAAAEDRGGAGFAITDRAGLRGWRHDQRCGCWPADFSGYGVEVAVTVPGIAAGRTQLRAASRPAPDRHRRAGRKGDHRSLEQQQPGGDTHWSTRSMVRSAGMAQSAVSRIWRAFGLRPHITQT